MTCFNERLIQLIQGKLRRKPFAAQHDDYQSFAVPLPIL
jgi:hypothetical protein